MRLLLTTFLFIFFATQRTLSSDVVEPTETILIYQSGRVLSIHLDGTEKEIGQFSPDLNISSSAYDDIGNSIYAIIVDEPYNPGLRRYTLMSFDLSHQIELVGHVA